MENMQILQADAFPVDPFRKNVVLLGGPSRKNPPGRLMGAVIADYFLRKQISHLRGHIPFPFPQDQFHFLIGLLF